MTEEWRPLKDFPGYKASSHGRIMRPGGIIAAQCFDQDGYMLCTLNNGKSVQRRVARIICQAFHGDPPTPKHQAAHRDGEKTHNRAHNLYWATNAENTADRTKHGIHREITRKRFGKLTVEDIAEIRARRAAGEQVTVIHKDFSQVCRATVSHIANNRTWQDV